jgi:hypothetical protein
MLESLVDSTLIFQVWVNRCQTGLNFLAIEALGGYPLGVLYF